MSKNSLYKKICKEDLPSLFQAADNASNEAQKRYLKLMGLDIVLIILPAILSVVAFTNPNVKMFLLFLAAVFVGLSIIVTLVIRIAQFEKTWYDGRAVAESVKTLAWRYMMCAEPYTCEISLGEVDCKFAVDLDAILKERKNLFSSLGGHYGTKPQISNKMRETRHLDTFNRKDIYIVDRIEDQRKWYSDKADFNKKSEGKWFIAMLIFQLLGLVSAILLLIFPKSPINFTGFFTTLVTSCLAWIQLKQFQELAQSYGIAVQELGLIAEQGHHIKNDQDLSTFVSDSENAISREHTLWIARRDKN